MNFNIITLGCKVNQYESQAMREAMLKAGFQLSGNAGKADITIINSCTVTSVSDAKNRRLINRVRRENPVGIIVLTGCMPQAFPDETNNFENCDIVLGNAKRAELVPTIKEYLENHSLPKTVFISFYSVHYMNIASFWTRSVYFKMDVIDFAVIALYLMREEEYVQKKLSI